MTPPPPTHAELRRVAELAGLREPYDRVLRQAAPGAERVHCPACGVVCPLYPPHLWGVLASRDAAGWTLGQCACGRLWCAPPGAGFVALVEAVQRYRTVRAGGGT